MAKIAGIPSGSSHMSTKQTRNLIKSESRMQLISRWKDEIDDKQIEQAQQILDIYEIDIYNLKEVMHIALYLLP